MKLGTALVPVWVAYCIGVGGNSVAAQMPRASIVGGGCEGCELIFAGMPEDLTWETTVADSAEVGEPLEISGTVYLRDGKTPAGSIILYVYHTDARGLYAPTPGQKQGRRHGHLRGWMRTDADGRYKFRTIRPAPYPNARIPAHIHPIVKEPDKNEYWLDEYVFADDELLTKAERQKLENRGGSGIITLAKNAAGVWVGHRDLILGLNIPHYPSE